MSRHVGPRFGGAVARGVYGEERGGPCLSRAVTRGLRGGGRVGPRFGGVVARGLRDNGRVGPRSSGAIARGLRGNGRVGPRFSGAVAQIEPDHNHYGCGTSRDDSPRRRRYLHPHSLARAMYESTRCAPSLERQRLEAGPFSPTFVIVSSNRRSSPATGLAARGESLAAFDGRCIPAGRVAPRSNTPGILGRRALPAGRLARLGATPDFHHGLSGPVGPVRTRTSTRTASVADCSTGS